MPDPYLLGASKLGADPTKCAYMKRKFSRDIVSEDALGLVVEDAPSGVRSGKAAGCAVLALLTTHSRSSLEEAKADWIVKDLSRFVICRARRMFEY